MSSRRESGGVDRASEREAAGLTIDENSPYEEMAIVEKFERFINYIYPILQNTPRIHGIARDKMLTALFDQVELLKIAGKSGNASRLYSADAQLSLLRFYLRFAVHKSRKIITPHQNEVAQTHLAEVGRMLGGWIKTVKAGVVRDKWAGRGARRGLGQRRGLRFARVGLALPSVELVRRCRRPRPL